MMQKMEELVDFLNKCSYEYYTMSNPKISDKEYDEKYNELTLLEKRCNVIMSNSPTKRVGDIVLDKFEKHKHLFKCYSMDKSQTEDELLNWNNKVKMFIAQNNLPKIQYVVEKKFDGLTINNTYNTNGDLEFSTTRGTGEIGELVTEQVKTIKSIPLHINNGFVVEIHGEALMTKKAFRQYNKTAEAPLKNLRNGAAGAIKNLNTKETAKRNLSAFFYDVGYSKSKTFETYIDMMNFIEEMGLPVDKEYYLCDTIEEVKEKIKLIEKLRPSLEYEIDGAIISINDIKTRELMGYTTKYPKWAIAYKYEAEETTTEVLDCEFNTGRTGKVTPRAIIEPVELMGATVGYATLNSMDDIKRKGVKIGATVFIRRSNDVIPEILGIVEDSITDDMQEISMPTHCLSCGSELVQDGVHYFCKNSLNCRAQIVKSIAQFGSIHALNIEGFSEKTAELFYDNGIVSSVLDLFYLEDKKDKIINLPNFGVNKYNNLIKAINKARDVNLNQFIYALGIDGIGKKASSDLVKYFEYDIDRIVVSSYEELLKIEGFGEITARSVVDYFSNETLILVNNLLNEMNIIKSQEKQIITNSPFSGKKVYCTGSFSSYKKDELRSLLESLGAEFASGYAKSLDYLIVGSLKGSSKEDKAKADGVTILSENEFIEMIS